MEYEVVGLIVKPVEEAEPDSCLGLLGFILFILFLLWGLLSNCCGSGRHEEAPEQSGKETGVAYDTAAVIPSRPSGNTGITPGPRPDQMKAPRPVPSRSRDDLLKMRTWRDRHGHNVTATLISVMDPRGRTVETLGRDPAALYRGGLTVHLQRNDGKIIQVPIAKFSEDDIIFLARGR